MLGKVGTTGKVDKLDKVARSETSLRKVLHTDGRVRSAC